MSKRNRLPLLLLSFSLCLASPAAAQQPAPAMPDDLQDIRQYLTRAWDTLTRSPRRCETFQDLRKQQQTPILYLPKGFPVPAQVRELQQHCPLEVRHLPQTIERLGTIDVNRLEPGLLYLEHDYVVPGGFFNEMYGWDSYFILRGLLHDGRLELARGMVENFFFQIEHYGAILNANRTYFLTRSQPPFLTSMILGVYEAQKAKGTDDKQWLARAYGYAVRDWELWNSGEHLAGQTGLARYYDYGDGPAPDVLAMNDPYYRVAANYFLRRPEEAGPFLITAGPDEPLPHPDWPSFSLYLCDQGESPGMSQGCRVSQKVALTVDFYKGDRSMRESGFDISHRFGPLSAATHFFAAVCLNSLLYKAESDLARISEILGRPQDVQRWQQRAARRRERITQYLWDKDRGLFFDYNVRTGGHHPYEFITTFYPLWVGAATTEQAAAVMKNLPLFEQPGGLAMSREETRAQWDYPYGWAPTHLIAVEGMRRYGYNQEADRIARKFTTMVVENFRRDGTIREKYNVVTRTTETRIEAGYTENVVGFGWTNGVFMELLEGLRQKEKPQAARD